MVNTAATLLSPVEESEEGGEGGGVVGKGSSSGSSSCRSGEGAAAKLVAAEGELLQLPGAPGPAGAHGDGAARAPSASDSLQVLQDTNTCNTCSNCSAKRRGKPRVLGGGGLVEHGEQHTERDIAEPKPESEKTKSENVAELAVVEGAALAPTGSPEEEEEEETKQEAAEGKGASAAPGTAGVGGLDSDREHSNSAHAPLLGAQSAGGVAGEFAGAVGGGTLTSFGDVGAAEEAEGVGAGNELSDYYNNIYEGVYEGTDVGAHGWRCVEVLRGVLEMKHCVVRSQVLSLLALLVQKSTGTDT